MSKMTTANIMVMLEHPPNAQLRQGIGDGTRTALDQYATEQRDHLIDWVNERGLSEQLVCIDEPISAHLLRIEGTPTLASALQRAPDILCVAMVGDFQVTILDT